MADVVPIGKHKEFARQTKQSAAGVLRAVRALNPTEVFVIAIDPAGNLVVSGSPCDPGNALWLMEMAKQKLMGLR